MKFKELVEKSRSVRRFGPDEVSLADLMELVELARLGPSAANLQPLKYLLITNKIQRDRLFPLLSWAGYLCDWSGPDEQERPKAYIIICADQTIRPDVGCDQGIAAQNIMLGAAEKGLSGCMIGAFNSDGLQAELRLDQNFKPLLVLAIGYPAETVVLDEAENGNIRYSRDSASIHHVPKRPLQDLLIHNNQEDQ